MANENPYYTSPAEILEKDTSQEYLTMLRIYGDEEYNAEFVQHMLDAAIMSHYKYGWVSAKPSSHYQMLAGFEDAGFAKDKNLEHMINIANYAMFRYMMNGRKGAEPENPEKLIQIGVEAMTRYNHPEEGEFYQGTDSDKSVVKKRVKPKPIRDHLHDLLLQGPYEFINNDPVVHFDINDW